MAFDGGLPRRDRRRVPAKLDPAARRDRALAAAMRKHEAKRQAAISATQFEKYESAVVEWLMSSVNNLEPPDPGPQSGFTDFRDRFRHRLSKASPKTLSKVRALFSRIIDAFDENDGPALEQAAGFLDLFLSLGDANGRILRALSLVQHGAASFAHVEGEVSSMLSFYLTVCDARFGRLKPEKIREVLARVRHDRNRTGGVKGGRGRIGAERALAELGVAVRAFGWHSLAVAKQKITDAKRPKRPRKRSSRTSGRTLP